jgi:dihydrofolate synthase/folylpolyglutamate synthase
VTTPWSPEDAERHLLSLELFGMRFGLDRMRRLMTALGSPEQAFRSIHVVGTNGKSSTVRMIAAVLEAHGHRTGAYLSPHLVGFEERVRIGDEDVEPEAFAAAVQRAAHAAGLVDRTSPEGDSVTQFELLTAAAYSELARRGVDVAVIEAGLGGRYDATSVIPSSVQVLTNVGLEHTRWLGPTVRDIAREKLAVVREGATLVIGPDLHPDARAEAELVAERQGARLLVATADRVPPGLPAYPRRNFALATAAAEAQLGTLDDARTAEAVGVRVPGRLEPISEHPLTLLDGAHNPAGMDALVESLPDVVPDGAPLVAVLSILDDKDAAAMLRSLLPHCAKVVFCRSANPRALSPSTLVSLAGQIAPDGDFAVEPQPAAALARARELAGADGAVVATGSIYLVSDLVRPAGRRAVSL